MASNNRSPSPMSSRPRTPELNHPVRRSFNGSPLTKPSIGPNPRTTNNPMTPSKSPSDFGRRSSVDNEKENGRDHQHHNHMKVSKLKSPVAKGMKNFMSPTISAASKMNAPSPRRDILGERNELIRSFDGKSSIDTLSCVSEDDKTDASSESDVSHDADLTVVHKNVGDKSPRLITSLESNFKNSPRADCSPCPIIAPLDADPSLPPYDPKTNYLSPRPQFLHYKPNPRIQVYLNKKKGLDTDTSEGLEELFMFESSSDADITDETQSEGLTGESDDASSVDAVVIQEEEIEEVVFESQSGKQPVAGGRGLKRKSCVRIKYLSWIMVFAIAFASMSVSDTPVIGNPVHKNMGLSEIYCLADEAADFAKEHLAVLVSNFEVWRESSVSYLSKLVFDPNIDNLASLQYGNITTMEHDDQSLMSDSGNKVTEESYQVENEYGQETDLSDELVSQEVAEGDRVEESGGLCDAEGEGLFEETYSVNEFAQEIGGGHMADDNLGGISGSEVEVMDRTVFEVLQDEQTDMKFETNENVEVVSTQPESNQFVEEDAALENQTINFSKTEQVEFQQDSDIFEDDENKERESSLFKEESVSEPQISQIQPKMLMVESMESQGESVGPSSTSFEVHPETSPTDVENEISEATSQINSSVDGNFVRYIVGISSLILAGLAAATAFSFAKQTKALKSDSEVPLSPKLAPMELTHAEVSSQDWSDMASESWNSGMSSTQRKSLISTKKGAAEVQNQQKKTSKRESFASSDCSMSSYGSFSTYEILHKKIQGDEETIVTPVRRSSRIRKQVSSP